jgi:hypothetical protein
MDLAQRWSWARGVDTLLDLIVRGG